MPITRQTLAAAVVAALPLLTVSVPTPAQAQNHPRATRLAPHIESFNVDEVRRLEPGADLNFQLVGTPGGVATLRIAGATRNVRLTETAPGTYEGAYTIGVHDRITPGSSVTANLRANRMVTTRTLSESLVMSPARYDGGAQYAGAPRVERFNVAANDDLRPGNDLKFTVMGTPGAKVEVQIAGTRGIFYLPEVRPGEYAGVYTIRRDDRIAPDAPVTATIRANGRYTTATLAQPLLAGRRDDDRREQWREERREERRAERENVARYCTNCATVAAVNVVQVDGGTNLGTLAGAAVGGILGNQVGSGNGRTAATAAGAIGGAVAGREIERNRTMRQRYEVVVRYPNGATQTIPYDNDPGFRVGDQVKVNDGMLTRD